MAFLSPFPIQKKHIDHLTAVVGEHGVALDSSDMGCGKTLCAVEVAKNLGLKPFVVCPKVVIPAWEETIKGQGTKGIVVGWEKLRTGNTAYVERRGKGKFIWRVKKDDYLVIFDEVHKAKGIKTLNAKMAMAAGEHIKLMLSATPMEDPREMKAIGYLLGLHNGRNFYPWAQMWGAEFDPWGALVFPDHAKFKLPELQKLIYPEKGGRITRDDLGDKFSECRINMDPVDFGGSKLANLMQDLEDELDRIEAREKADGDDAIPLTKLLRLRQKIEMLKIPVLAELVDDARNQGMSPVVFLNFRDSMEALENRLKTDNVSLHGGQSDSERASSLENFNENKIRTIICQTQAGGVGVSLHDTDGRFPRISFISPDYNAKNFHQVTGRTDRLGGKSKALIKVLVAAGTVEQKIMERLMGKIQNIDLLKKDNTVDSKNSDMKGKDSKEVHIDSEGQAHHDYGPSGLKNRAKCAGFSPKRGTNPAAEMGTRIHKALETGDWSKLSDWESHLTQRCQDTKDKILRLNGFTPGSYLDHPEILLNIPLAGGEEIFGTCDVLCLKEGHALQMDYKTGVHRVDPIMQNYQAKAYAVGAFEKFAPLEKITFYMICAQREEVLFGEFTKDMVPDLKEELGAVIKRSKKTLADWPQVKVEDLTPSPLNCEYCANAGSCPALGKRLVDLAAVHPSVDILDKPLIGAAADMDDPLVVSQLLDFIPVIEEAISGWKARSRAMIFEEHTPIPGYEVKERAAPRKITDVSAAYSALRDNFGEEFNIADFLDALKSFPVLKFEKIISSHAKHGKKKETISQITRDLEESGAIDHGGGVIQYVSKIK